MAMCLPWHSFTAGFDIIYTSNFTKFAKFLKDFAKFDSLNFGIFQTFDLANWNAKPCRIQNSILTFFIKFCKIHRQSLIFYPGKGSYNMSHYQSLSSHLPWWDPQSRDKYQPPQLSTPREPSIFNAPLIGPIM